ncbi:MAG: leucine-rich repeat protein [Oscillospiraceae bacterium]|nr:leucine-rich repeat protein [Oscillospiraceae bacterium]
MKNAELRRFLALTAALFMAAGTTVTAYADEVTDTIAAAGKNVAEAETSEYSGKCGDNSNWSFDAETGIYTVSGTGAVDFMKYNDEWVKNVKTVIVEDGITWFKTVAAGFCFSEAESVFLPESLEGFSDESTGLCYLPITSINLPDKITRLNKGLMESCPNLKDVKLPAELKVIEDYVFFKDASLESIVIPEKTEEIGEFVFLETGLKSVTILSNDVKISDNAFYLCDPSMVICAAKGSTAEKYAEEHGFQFKALEDDDKFKAGDADGNGAVDISDITVFSLALADRTELSDAQKKALDVDGDGDVTLADLAKLRQYLSKKIEKL